MSLGLLTSSLRALKGLKDVPYERALGLVTSRLVDTDGDFSHIFQRKSRLQMVLLSCAVCGIEFCYAAETAFTSPLLLEIGVPVLYMTLVWCISPALGFFLVPFLGSVSDRCSLRMGRRRPFILLLSVGIVFGLLMVPCGRDIGRLLGDRYEGEDDEPPPVDQVNVTVSPVLGGEFETTVSTPWNNFTETYANGTSDRSGYVKPSAHPWSIVFTVIGVAMLDFCCDACQSPCRAYLVDVTIVEDHPRGLSTFTVMAGLGGSIGYVIGGINWGNTAFGTSIVGHVKVVFTVVLILYLICLALTVTSVKEVPLEKLGVMTSDLQKTKIKVSGRKYRKFANESDSSDDEGGNVETAGLGSVPAAAAADYGSQGKTEQMNAPDEETGNGSSLLNSKTADGADVGKDHVADNSQPLPEMDKGALPLQPDVTLKTYLKSIVTMPRSLFILCLTNLFCWMSLVCYSLYFTDFVGKAVYGGDPIQPPGSPLKLLYEQGVKTGSLGMSLYSLSCSIYSFCIERLMNKFGARTVYICSQLIYCVGAILMAAIREPAAVIVLSVCPGIMYATLFTMPYLLVAHYHSTDQFEDASQTEEAIRRRQCVRGLGTDIAVVSSMVFVAQFFLSAVIGSLVHATGSTVAVVVCAAVLSLCGAVTATQVLYLDL